MGKKVLILEDNKDALEMLSDIVKSVSEDIEIFRFSSMDGVYDVVMEHTIDLFIVDIVINPEQRGDVSGIRFIDHIRTIPRYEFTPVIFTSSLLDTKMYAYSELRSFSYIEKPYKADQVRDKVSKALHYNSPSISDKTMYFKQGGLIYALKCAEVIYAENINRKMYFHRSDGNIIEIPYKTCKQIIDEANYKEFVQCNRNTIINWNYVERIDVIKGFIKLLGVPKEILIGVTYKKRISDIVKYGL